MTAEPRLLGAQPGRLLVITAHPDDADSAIAGSVSAWIAAGAVAHLVCCTSGDAGSTDAGTDPLELAARREAEQRAAAGIVGYEGVTFLHRPDGALLNDLALREQLVRIIRTFGPDVVAAPDPTVVFPADGAIQHVDHREAGLAAVDAVHPAARNAMAFSHLVSSEGLEPHAVSRLFLFWSNEPDSWVAISDTIETKLAAIREHRSQLREPQQAEQLLRARAASAGLPLGIGSAEAFRVIDLE